MHAVNQQRINFVLTLLLRISNRKAKHHNGEWEKNQNHAKKNGQERNLAKKEAPTKQLLDKLEITLKLKLST